MNNKCENCGSTQNLNHHHIHPKSKKLFPWCQASKKTVTKEQLKCMLLCCSCHKRLHGEIKRQQWKILLNYLCSKTERNFNKNLYPMTRLIYAMNKVSKKCLDTAYYNLLDY